MKGQEGFWEWERVVGHNEQGDCFKTNAREGNES